MYATDENAFGELLQQLATMFGKELTNEHRTLYWNALRDLPLPQVKARASSHMRHGKFFPKPYELRPADEKPLKVDATAERAFSAAVRRSCENLDELRRSAGEDAWRSEVRLRYADRMIATAHPSSPEYSDALRVRQLSRGST